jgi:hypothetical protein
VAGGGGLPPPPGPAPRAPRARAPGAGPPPPPPPPPAGTSVATRAKRSLGIEKSTRRNFLKYAVLGFFGFVWMKSIVNMYFFVEIPVHVLQAYTPRN